MHKNNTNYIFFDHC